MFQCAKNRTIAAALLEQKLETENLKQNVDNLHTFNRN